MSVKGWMRYQCRCGVEYAVSPKEIPLAKEEVIFCECGHMIRGKHSTKFFDYARIRSWQDGASSD
jgi:hypothetical protein